MNMHAKSIMTDTFDYKAAGKKAILIEAEALTDLEKRIDDSFVEACRLIQATKGKLVLMGIGKSGHIAKKIAATFASTGTPAFFIHPAEAGHGDLGMIRRGDTLLVVSHSGASPEMVSLLPIIRQLDVPLIVMSARPRSPLAENAQCVLDVAVKEEACPLDLAPTASTTAALVMGDALAVALLEANGFSSIDFARSHPSGSLGKQLLLRIKDILPKPYRLPMVEENLSLTDAIVQISEGGLGMVCVLDRNKQVSGIFTDGDLRRQLLLGVDLPNTPIAEVMTHSPLMVAEDAMAIDALKLMEQKRITTLLVHKSDQPRTALSILHMHDLVHAGLHASA